MMQYSEFKVILSRQNFKLNNRLRFGHKMHNGTMHGQRLRYAGGSASVAQVDLLGPWDCHAQGALHEGRR